MKGTEKPFRRLLFFLVNLKGINRMYFNLDSARRPTYHLEKIPIPIFASLHILQNDNVEMSSESLQSKKIENESDFDRDPTGLKWFVPENPNDIRNLNLSFKSRKNIKSS